MPCRDLIEEFEREFSRGADYLVVPSTNPFAKAVREALAEENIWPASEVRMYSKDRLSILVDVNEADNYGFMTRKRKTAHIPIVKLHEEAVRFLPAIDPLKVTVEDLKKRHHPGNPKDLSDKPLSLKRGFEKIELSDGYAYNEVWK